MVSSADNYVDLISQLEEAKFLQLFKHLLKNSYVGSCIEGVPVPVPNAELWYRVVWPQGATSVQSMGELFQIVHLPQSLWGKDVIEKTFLKNLRAALVSLRGMDAIRPVLGLSYSYLIDDKKESRKYEQYYRPSEGSTYYLFTNVDHDYFLSYKDGQYVPSEAVNKIAKELFKDVLGISLGWVGFGVGTPRTAVSGAHSEVEEAIVRLINTPSDYYLIARGGRICVVPETNRGLYFASDSTSKTIGEASRGLCASLTGRLSKSVLIGAGKLEELESLINNRGVKERDIQAFLEDNPGFLFSLNERYCELRPQVGLVDKNDIELVPDFMARVEDTYIWDIIELKLPRHPIVIQRRGQARPSAIAAKAICQLLKYSNYFSVRRNRNKIHSEYGISAYEPALVLVMGRSPSRQVYQWESVKKEFPMVKSSRTITCYSARLN